MRSFLEYATRCPSGDHLGVNAPPGSSVSGVTMPVARSTIHSWSSTLCGSSSCTAARVPSGATARVMGYCGNAIL